MLTCGVLNGAYLPVLLAVLCTATFGATYVLAVYRGDVDAVLPYISDTGAHRPESCIFAQALNAAAFLCE